MTIVEVILETVWCRLCEGSLRYPDLNTDCRCGTGRVDNVQFTLRRRPSPLVLGSELPGVPR